MATAANLAPGATPKHSNNDPFVSTPSPFHSSQLRYATLDSDQFSSYATNSPAQARKALEAHLKETDRRIHDAAKLGNSLLEQKKSLASKLKEVEEVNPTDEMPAALRQKLVDIEKEYNEVGRESARAFLPKLKPSSDAATLSGHGVQSPSKSSSRRQRNQPAARAHDIEFAAEISTQLLAQVRQLQAALAEKDETLKDTAALKAQLETEMNALSLKYKSMDERSQGYKDESWNLETRIQELEAALKTSTDNEHRLGQHLSATQTDRTTVQRELDELRNAHDKAIEAHATHKKQLDTDIHALRRDVANTEADKQLLEKRIDELNNNNKELARAVSYRLASGETTMIGEEHAGSDEDQDMSIADIDMSPVKGTPARPGMLESETLKSSLTHAHRMIQNLKNNIHREKTEKLELKRMLNEARDDLEKRRNDGGTRAVNDKAIKKREGRSRPVRLGAVNGITTSTEILDEPEWEDQDGEVTPSRPTHDIRANSRQSEEDSTDAFETADERRETATETEGFQTGLESLDDDSDDLTETEDLLTRSITVRKHTPLTMPSTIPSDRVSLRSTASTSDEDEPRPTRTPSQSIGPKYRLRSSKSARRSLRQSQIFADSPASNNSTPQNFGKSLGDELDELDVSSVENTPSKTRDESLVSSSTTPETQRSISTVTTPLRHALQSSPVPPMPSLDRSPEADFDQTVLVHDTERKPAMVDAGVMTEPWKSEEVVAAQVDDADEGKSTVRKLGERVAGVAGGALAGFGIGRVSKDQEFSEPAKAIEPTPVSRESEELQSEPIKPGLPQQSLSFSSIISQHTEPVEPQDNLVIPSTPLVPKRSSKRLNSLGATDIPRPESLAQSDTIDAITTPKTERSEAETLAGAETSQSQYVEPQVYGGGKGANGIPTLTFGDEEPVITSTPTRRPLGEISSNVGSKASGVDEDLLPITKPLQIRKQMVDESSQTVVSGQEIDSMMRDKSVSKAGTAGVIAGAVADEASRSPKRPQSSNSTRNRDQIQTPPLPPDHTQKIAAAAKTPAPTSIPGSMGPPLMPASAYKKRPTTPAGTSQRISMSRDGTTPRAARNSVRESSASGRASRSTSVSSFASELDERFDLHRSHLMYPDDVAPATDPRMIQAITQTMIGEYLWKYTRKAGRTETSNIRHRRFFWVHPYTRTLYWSVADPSTASKDMMKAKSVPIESVRVITDDNVNPPGLHRKSIVITTRSRDIVVTAPTSQRHETWFNALSYLLLRSDAEKAEADNAINDEDLEEFNPGGFSIRRSISRMTRGRSRSRVSLSSYNSRATRNSSPTQNRTGAIEERQAGMARSQSSAPADPIIAQPTLNASTSSRTGRKRDSSRFSSITSRFNPANTVRGSVAAQSARTKSSLSNHSDGAGEIYNAHVIGESAEDVRKIIEQQDRDAEMLENVRACCDGKHDVGSLSRNSKRMSIKSSRVGGSHHHNHSRTSQVAEPATSSSTAPTQPSSTT